jgi:hypothetical protein
MPAEDQSGEETPDADAASPTVESKVPISSRVASWLRTPSRSRRIVGWTLLGALTAGALVGVDVTQDAIDWPQTFASGKDLAEILAVLVGGVWAYRRFIRQREHQPRANISHRLSTILLDNDHRFVRVAAHVKNIGQTAIRPPTFTIELKQLAPLPPDVISTLYELPSSDPQVVRSKLPDLGRREVDLGSESTLLDSGEEDDFFADFVLKSDVEVIEVTSQLDCGPDTPGVAWFETSLHRLGPDLLQSDLPAPAAGSRTPSPTSGGRPAGAGTGNL